MSVQRDAILVAVVLVIVLLSLPSLSNYADHNKGIKSSTVRTDQKQPTTTLAGGGAAGAGSATSGRVFSMTRVRTLPSDIEMKHQHYDSSEKRKNYGNNNSNIVWHIEDDDNNVDVKDCKYWGTLTTIFEVTDAAKKIADLPGWCLVVTGDRKGPPDYDIFLDAEKTKKMKNVVFLSAERQQQLANDPTMHAFVSKTPWNHFARKNVAYLFAIAHEAQLIFDFDDDNVLLDTTDNTNNPLFAFAAQQSDPQQRQNLLRQDEGITDFTKRNEDGIRVLVPRHPRLSVDENDLDDSNRKCLVFNNYNAFVTNTTDTHIWPRGYPLDDITPCHRKIYEFDSCVLSTTSQNTQIVIWQSVAQIDPDVDGIYRLTRKTQLPVEFDLKTNAYPVLVPTGMFSPMNAQAAVFHTKAAFTLFLPTTVHGRVSDIWRSYIAQTLFQHMGLQVAFAGRPLVAQYRNAHNYLADFMAEEPLYERTGSLVEYLSTWRYNTTKNNRPTTQGAMEQLFVDLYEHGILELEDVILIQEWINVLNAMGYEFPPWTDSKGTTQQQQATSCTPRQPVDLYANVAFMGQFNYNQDIGDVVHWARKWSTIFSRFQARGPFSVSHLKTLQAYGIITKYGKEDGGLYSPMTNMAEALREYSQVPGVVGVVYAHDDLIMNISFAKEVGVGTDHTIVTQVGPDLSSDPGVGWKSSTMPLTEAARRRFEPLLVLSPRGQFALASDTNRTFNVSDISQYPSGLEAWKRTMPSLAKAVSRDRRLRKYFDRSGIIPVPVNGFAHFAYVPTSASGVFAEVADAMADNEIFLEGGLHVASLLSKREHTLTPSVMGTCVARDGTKRVECLNSFVGLYQALKLSEMGKQLWDEYFDIISSL